MRILRTPIIAAVLAASVCCPFDASALDKMIVGYTAVGGNAPVYIAKDEGFFSKRGLDVDLLLVSGGSVLVPSLLANSIQIGTLPTPTMIQAADGGIDLVAITNLSSFILGMKDSGVVVRKGANIKIPGDLKGKRIGTSTIGGVSEIMFDKWLMVKGLRLKDVTMVEVAYAQMPDVIRGGNIDAVLIPDPFKSAIEAAGTGEVLAYYIGEIADNVSSIVNGSTRAWVDAHPQELAAFRGAIAEAVEFGKANPEKSLGIIGRTLKLKPEVMAATQMAPLSSSLTAADITWWLDTMNEQGRLRSRLDPARLIAQ
jgi:NitT/TauT family transport system substrate-binding protein